MGWKHRTFSLIGTFRHDRLGTVVTLSFEVDQELGSPFIADIKSEFETAMARAMPGWQNVYWRDSHNDGPERKRGPTNGEKHDEAV